MITKKNILTALILFIMASLYLFNLSKTPVYLNQDEMMFSLNAHSIAISGLDFYGNKLPFYFWHLGAFWATPVITYVTSIFLRFLPFSEWSIRIPSVFMGLVSILGVSVICKKIFKGGNYFLFGAVIASTVPALYINSRMLLDNIWPIPFVVAWILCLKLFTEKENSFILFISGLSLGFGLHAYHAAKIYMPLYFLITLAYIFVIKKAKLFNIFALIVGFFIPIIIFIPWLKVHPDTLLNQVSYIGSHDATVSVSKGIWGVFNLSRLGDITTNYLTYFSPKFLFLEGDRTLIHSTVRVGTFTFGVAFLLLFGIFEVFRKKTDWFPKVILFGFVTYPLAPAIVDDPQRISRGLVVIPFVVILSIYGINFLLNQKERIFTNLVKVIFIFIILEFAIFLSDHFGNYRIRSGEVFNGPIGPLFESVIKSTSIRPVEKIYVARSIYFAEYYFDFYQIKFGKDLSGETIYFDTQRQDFSKFESGSLIALKASDVPTKPERIGPFEKIETIRDLSGNEDYFVYWRDK